MVKVGIFPRAFSEPEDPSKVAPLPLKVGAGSKRGEGMKLEVLSKSGGLARIGGEDGPSLTLLMPPHQ